MSTFSLLHKPIPILRPIALMAGVLFSGGAASACYTVKIENTSQQEIRVGWGAIGCGKVWEGEQMICTHHTVTSGTTKSYDFPWLTTAPSIFVYFNYQGKDTDKYTTKYFGNRARFQYNLKDGKFTTRHGFVPESAPHCHEHYTIHYSQEVLQSQWNEIRTQALKQAHDAGDI